MSRRKTSKKLTTSFETKVQKRLTEKQLIAVYDGLLQIYAQDEVGKTDFVKTHEGSAQVKTPVTERHAPGVYLREIFMPKGAVICGQRHKTEHFNIILEGAVRCIDEAGNFYTLEAPYTFVSAAGMRKMFGVIRDCRWITIHPNPQNYRDTSELARILVEPQNPQPTIEDKQPALAGAPA